MGSVECVVLVGSKRFAEKSLEALDEEAHSPQKDDDENDFNKTNESKDSDRKEKG